MSKFNATKVTGPTGINHMGEKAYVMNDKEALTQLVLTTFLCNSYYATDTQIMNRINELVSKVGPEFSAKLALYARTKANMRSVSHLIAALVCKDAKNSNWLKHFYKNIVVRPDDMSEILCCYAKFNGIDLNGSFRKIPNSMKKGFKLALERLTPYQIDKYKMNSKTVSLIDLVNLFHPRSTEANAEAYRRLMHGESLEGTYDSKILEKEMSASCQGDDVEDKNLAKHDAIASVLKSGSGMPIMNLLRNLKNIMLYAPDMIDEAINQLTNETKIINSRLLPFRFSSAYDVINSIEVSDYKKSDDSGDSKIVFESEIPSMTKKNLNSIKEKVLKAIDDAMKVSCKNVPELDGNCAILVDHSGSVRGDYHGSSTVSPWSRTTTAMIGNLFGTIMTFKQKNVYFGMFGDKLISPTIDRNLGLLEFNAKTYDVGGDCGGATENGLYKFMKDAIKNNKKIDNLIIFSDMEIGDGGEGGWDVTSYTRGVHFHELFAQFRKINPHCLTVCCNINGRSGTSVFNPNLNLLNISGWSNAIFDTIAMYQNGKVKSLVDEIENIEL